MPSDLEKNLTSSNEKYASSFDEGGLALPPAKNYIVGKIDHLRVLALMIPPVSSLTERRRVHDTRVPIVVTCMDARIDPAAAFGIELGDAHVIRNVGLPISSPLPIAFSAVRPFCNLWSTDSILHFLRPAVPQKKPSDRS
jgi:Carbonic anhydrase